MADLEKLHEDIETLKESVRRDWFEMATRPMSKEERQGVRAHINLCVAELSYLLVKMDEADA